MVLVFGRTKQLKMGLQIRFLFYYVHCSNIMCHCYRMVIAVLTYMEDMIWMALLPS